MARRRRRPRPDELLGSLEARIMQDIWKNGESSVNDVLERLNGEGRKQLAYNTVMSVMARLETKGYLERERDGRAYLYWPAFDKDQLITEMAVESARDYIQDFGEAALSGFVREVSSDAELMDELQRLIDESR